MKKKSVNAVNDDVIVTLEFKEQSSGGIYLADQAKSADGEFYGIVVSVGPDYKENVKPGDKILFTRDGQTPEGLLIESDGQKYWRLRAQWVMAVVG